MRQALAMLLLAAAPALAKPAPAWELYHAPEANAAALTQQVQPLLPEGKALQLHALPAELASRQDAELQARAIAAGVRVLPCLVLRDDKGVYATLPLQGLSAESIAQACRLADAPERAAAARRRILLAHLYLQRYLLNSVADAAEQDRIIAHMQQLADHPDTPEEMRQFIGLHCIYPALMQQYAAAYRGAHTPQSEAKLLEAIRALENVRDTNPLTTLGRQAYTEREKLRAARLKSRQYE